MKKLVSILMAAVLLLCAVPVLAEGQTYTVGVCQLVTHDALDAATQGFIDALTEELGDAVTFDVQNAAGDSNTCSTIVNSFVAADVDLILANATAALQAAVAATADIPILGTSVTEYGVALDIDDFTGTVGGNVSGTSDLAPLDQQAAMVQTLYPFADSNDAAAVTQTAADASDVIYVPTDNTVAANTGIVDNICQPAGVPVIAGEEGICKGCGVATLSISYYDLGVTTGKMAAQILTGEADISTMPIAYAENFTPKFNTVIREALGIAMPEGVSAAALEKKRREKASLFPRFCGFFENTGGGASRCGIGGKYIVEFSQRAARRHLPGAGLGHYGHWALYYL